MTAGASDAQAAAAISQAEGADVTDATGFPAVRVADVTDAPTAHHVALRHC